MSQEEFLKQQFVTLRDEIRESKSRMFKLLVLGTLFIPAAGFAAHTYGEAYAAGSMPFVVLIVMIAFIMEQNSIVRAGRYLRENIEPQVKGVTGWEAWLESQTQHRSIDRAFVASFLLIFFLMYALAAGAAIEILVRDFRDFYMAAGIAYALGGLWFLFVFFRHWRGVTRTRP